MVQFSNTTCLKIWNYEGLGHEKVEDDACGRITSFKGLWKNKKYIYSSVPLIPAYTSWHKAPKALGIPWVIGASFVLLRQFLEGS